MVDKTLIGRSVSAWIITGFVAVSTCLSGCNKKESDETISLKGRIEKIRRISDSTGELTVRFFNEKQNKDVVGTASYSAETRIEKNGTPATVMDLQEGVLVNGQVRVQKEDGQRKYKAVLIQIQTPPPSSGG